MTKGQKAYEAYAHHQGGKSNSGASLPIWAAVAEANKKAWEDFGREAPHFSARDCYNYVYLGSTKGLSIDGKPAPSWAFFVDNRPDIAEAWEVAHLAAVSP